MDRFGKLDGPVFALLHTGPVFPILSHEDVESCLWVRLQLAPLIFLPLAVLWAFGLDHPRLPLLSYDNLLAPWLSQLEMDEP
jgi:hypothetical protein